VRIRAVLEDILPYHPPRLADEISVDRGSTKFVKLTMNELSFGPLPEAREAVVESLSRGGRYPDRDADPLREAIADANPGIAPDNVVVGNGTSEVLVDLMQILDRLGRDAGRDPLQPEQPLGHLPAPRSGALVRAGVA
jgi:histidinol-phosphate aminotransferase